MGGKVLCAVDVGHSEQGKTLLKKAEQLAALERAELDVITVVPGFGSSFVASYFPEGTEEKVVAEANQKLHTLVVEALGADQDAKARHIVAEGTVYEEVLAAAARIGATLIVIDSHRPDLKDFLLGPNAARVARHANCSVYIARL